VVAGEFIEKHCIGPNGESDPHNRSWREQKRHFDRYFIPTLGECLIQEITRRDIRRIVEGIAESGDRGRPSPYQANRALATVRAMFNWALGRDLIDVNPAERIAAPLRREIPRNRVLSAEEVRAVWRVADDWGQPFGNIVKLLLLTGCRLGEIRSLRWSEVDLDTKTITLTPERIKNKGGRDRADFIVPLSGTAVEILEALPRGGPFVFPGVARRDGRREPAPVCFNHLRKRKLDELSGVTDWRLHDLRRTAATMLQELGVKPHIIEVALNHISGSRGGIAGVYQRYPYAKEHREALDMLEQRILLIAENANVVPLRRSNSA
jgi:integrase